MAGEAAPAHRGFGGQTVHAVRLVQPGAHGIEEAAHAALARAVGQRLLDELRLAALSMWGNHQPPRDAVGGGRAVALAYEVQATVETGGGAGRGHEVAVVDVEHVRIHPHPWVAGGKIGCKAPVGGGRPAIEQTCRGQHIGPETKPDQARAALMGTAQGAQQRRGRWLLGVAPTGDDDDVGPRQRAQTVGDLHREAGGGTQTAGLTGADAKVETRRARMFVAEHDAGHGEVKRADAVKGDHGDHLPRLGRHGGCARRRVRAGGGRASGADFHHGLTTRGSRRGQGPVTAAGARRNAPRRRLQTPSTTRKSRVTPSPSAASAA